MADAVLVCAGTLTPATVERFRPLLTDAYTVAVDGGYELFRALKLAPNLLIGDLDSFTGDLSELPPSTEVVTFPSDKDATDLALALHHCDQNDLRRIRVLMPDLGDLDHLLGSLLLLAAFGKQGSPGQREIQIHTSEQIVEWCWDGERTITDRAGVRLSVIPLSEKIRLTTRGTDYDVTDCELVRGETRGLRNRLRNDTASVKVVGEAFIVFGEMPITETG